MREIHPISGACVWHGREMATSPRWRRRLGNAQLAEIDRAVRQASARGLGWQTLTADDFPLPSCAALAEDIRAELERTQAERQGRQFHDHDNIRHPNPSWRYADQG